MKKLKLFEAFAGYGGAAYGLKRAKIPYETVGYSGIGDINLDGQKTIMKYKQNIVELDIRNDQSIYRQVRFNMKRQKAIELFKDKTKKINSPNDRVLYFEKY